jgi:hypothetical protein
MQFFQNSWVLLHNAEEIFKTILDSDGSVKIDKSELKKYDKRIQTKDLQEFIEYFQVISLFLPNIPINEYYFLPQALINDWSQIKNQINACLTRIRTIRTVLKQPNAFLAMHEGLSRIQGAIDQALTLAYKLWFHRTFNPEDSIALELPQIPPDQYFPNIWCKIGHLLPKLITFNKDRFSWIQIFTFWTQLDNIFKAQQKKTGTATIGFSELFSHSDVITLNDMATEAIRTEIFYWFVQNEILLEKAPILEKEEQVSL